MADLFLATFGKPPRLLVCECERSGDTTLGQTFQLISGPELSHLLTDAHNRIGRLLEADKSDEQIIEELYWASLTRSPTESERVTMLEHVNNAKDRRKGLEDVAWALLNAKEFVLRK
jgi:hypothetical protein